MNAPIIIPRTHLILDAAILAAISAAPTPGSPFKASFGIRETMLPGWIIKTRGWNNADVETAEESDESLLYFPGITPKLALFTVRNLIDQLGGHLTGEDWHPGDKKPFDLFDVLSRSETDIFPDEFCEFCGGDIAGREEEAAKAIEDVLSSVYFRSTLTYDRLTRGGHSTCYMQTVFSSYSASDTGDAFGVSLNEDITPTVRTDHDNPGRLPQHSLDRAGGHAAGLVPAGERHRSRAGYMPSRHSALYEGVCSLGKPRGNRPEPD